jgi:UDP-N-acetylmuramyl tripeptide synthase
MTDTRRQDRSPAHETTETTQRWRVRPAPSDAPTARAGRYDLRTALAVDLGRAAARVSRGLGLGSGGMIGGRVALALRPDLLGRLGVAKQVVTVTGTNGKTTTTEMVAEALRSRGTAVSNATGANMLDGHVAALMGDRRAPYASLEVDELHLARVTEQFAPAVIVLLNLSRDQLDRVGEIRSVERSLRAALGQVPAAHVVANRDDPNIVSAAFDHPGVTWVSGGSGWKHDALTCPRCGTFLGESDRRWVCECGLFRPEADWEVTATGLRGPDGRERGLALRLPGHVNRINAAFALAVAWQLGCEADAALERIGGIEQANGRYARVALGGWPVRLLLAKNPASWLEMLGLVGTHRRRLVLAVNSRQADGYDVSWLWDIDFAPLRGRSVAVCGDRALDLAVRLRYAGVDCTVVSSVEEVLRRDAEQDAAADPPDVIANYTAFRDLFARSVRA